MTPFGLTLAQALVPLCAWAADHQALVEDIMLTRPKRPSLREVSGFDKWGRKALHPPTDEDHDFAPRETAPINVSRRGSRR